MRCEYQASVSSVMVRSRAIVFPVLEMYLGLVLCCIKVSYCRLFRESRTRETAWVIAEWVYSISLGRAMTGCDYWILLYKWG